MACKSLIILVLYGMGRNTYDFCTVWLWDSDNIYNRSFAKVWYKGMSQARKIYEYVAQSENRSVEQALVLAWRRAEEPYRTVIMETILDRGKSAATLEIIEQYHNLSPALQDILAQRVDSLYGGLYHGARSQTIQTRLNTLSVIGRGRYLPLIELVSLMLRDRDRRVSQQAGEGLRSLAQCLSSPNHNESPRGSQVAYSIADPVHKRQIVSALTKALGDFEVHHRVDTILAAMYIVSANDQTFWQDRLENYHAVGRAMRQILLTYDQPDIVPFCISALAHPSLRVTAARALATHQRPDYLSRLALEFARQANAPILQGLKLLRQPRWIEPDRFRPTEMTPRAQQALVSFVRRLHIEDREKALFLSAVAEKGAQPAALKAVVTLARIGEEVAGPYLERLVLSDSEVIAVAAALQIRKKKWSRFHRIMLERFSHGRGAVQELARQYLQELAFQRYWENFDRLPLDSRLAGGRAVFKIDPHAHTQWSNKAKDGDASQRLRALRVARLLERVDECLDTFVQLARDPDHKVRSCAVAGLGGNSRQTPAVNEQLEAALADRNDRVRANAIEALEQTAPPEKAEDISRFIHDDNNRVRANAIKALLHWKVASAKQAIAQMLIDPRPKHRLSARWVAGQMGIDGNDRMESLQPVVKNRQEKVLLSN
jgi:HEAT repeat protein